MNFQKDHGGYFFSGQGHLSESSILLILELAQPSSSPMALVIVAGQVYCFGNEGKGSGSVQWFPYNHTTIDKILYSIEGNIL